MPIPVYQEQIRLLIHGLKLRIPPQMREGVILISAVSWQS